jgi:hypothetical protein
VAAAALHDIGDVEAAMAASEKLVHSKQLMSTTWAALVRAATAAPNDASSTAPRASLLTEPNYRRIQLGWVE